MAINVQCPSCNRRAAVPDTATGKQIKCACGALFPVEAPLQIDDIALQPSAPAVSMSPSDSVSSRRRTQRREREPERSRNLNVAKIGAGIAAAGLLIAIGIYFGLRSSPPDSPKNVALNTESKIFPKESPEKTESIVFTQTATGTRAEPDKPIVPAPPKRSVELEAADRLYAELEKSGPLPDKIAATAQWLQKFSGDTRADVVRKYQANLLRKSTLLEVWARAEKLMPEIAFYNVEGGEHPQKEAIRLMRDKHYGDAWKGFSAAEDRMSTLRTKYQRAGDREQMLLAIYNTVLMQFYEQWALALNCVANNEDGITSPETVESTIKLLKSIEQQVKQINTELDPEPNRPFMRAVRIVIDGIEPLSEK